MAHSAPEVYHHPYLNVKAERERLVEEKDRAGLEYHGFVINTLAKQREFTDNLGFPGGITLFGIAMLALVSLSALGTSILAWLGLAFTLVGLVLIATRVSQLRDYQRESDDAIVREAMEAEATLVRMKGQIEEIDRQMDALTADFLGEED